MGFIGYLVVFRILVFSLEKISNKLLGVEKRKISETSGKNFDRWGKGIILVISLCILPFAFMKTVYGIKWFWIIYTAIIWGGKLFWNGNT